MKTNLTEVRSNFNLTEKLGRLLWILCWSCIAYLPRPASFLRIGLLRLFGAKIGKNCLIESGVAVWVPWNLQISDFVAIGRKVEIYNYALVVIESMTVVSQYSYICTGFHDYRQSNFPLLWKPIYIGSECWIAAGVWIMPGVSIGSGTVIGARSLVTKSLPNWMVCVGNPCRPIRERSIEEEPVSYL